SVLTKDDEIDVGSFAIQQWGEPIVKQTNRTKIDVEIETAPHAKQDVFGVFIRRNARIAERAGEDRVEVGGQHFERAVWQSDSVAQKLFSAPIEVDELERGDVVIVEVFEDENRLAHDFRTNSVAWDDCDSFHTLATKR